MKEDLPNFSEENSCSYRDSSPSVGEFELELKDVIKRNGCRIWLFIKNLVLEAGKGMKQSDYIIISQIKLCDDL